MKKYFYLFFLIVFTIFFLSCNDKNSKASDNSSIIISSDSINLNKKATDTLDAILEKLLSASAKDFYEHQPPIPIDFRNVQFKYYEEKIYVICGQFLVLENQKEEQWINFATIKTSDYEQWIGSNALSYCQNSKKILPLKRDLSSALKKQFNSLEKQNN
jgi:hypothetical protein